MNPQNQDNNSSNNNSSSRFSRPKRASSADVPGSRSSTRIAELERIRKNVPGEDGAEDESPTLSRASGSSSPEEPSSSPTEFLPIDAQGSALESLDGASSSQSALQGTGFDTQSQAGSSVHQGQQRGRSLHPVHSAAGGLPPAPRGQASPTVDSRSPARAATGGVHVDTAHSGATGGGPAAPLFTAAGFTPDVMVQFAQIMQSAFAPQFDKLAQDQSILALQLSQHADRAERLREADLARYDQVRLADLARAEAATAVMRDEHRQEIDRLFGVVEHMSAQVQALSQGQLPAATSTTALSGVIEDQQDTTAAPVRGATENQDQRRDSVPRGPSGDSLQPRAAPLQAPAQTNQDAGFTVLSGVFGHLPTQQPHRADRHELSQSPLYDEEEPPTLYQERARLLEESATARSGFRTPSRAESRSRHSPDNQSMLTRATRAGTSSSWDDPHLPRLTSEERESLDGLVNLYMQSADMLSTKPENIIKALQLEHSFVGAESKFYAPPETGGRKIKEVINTLIMAGRPHGVPHRFLFAVLSNSRLIYSEKTAQLLEQHLLLAQQRAATGVPEPEYYEQVAVSDLTGGTRVFRALVLHLIQSFHVKELFYHLQHEIDGLQLLTVDASGVLPLYNSLCAIVVRLKDRDRGTILLADQMERAISKGPGGLSMNCNISRDLRSEIRRVMHKDKLDGLTSAEQEEVSLEQLGRAVREINAEHIRMVGNNQQLPPSLPPPAGNKPPPSGAAKGSSAVKTISSAIMEIREDPELLKEAREDPTLRILFSKTGRPPHSDRAPADPNCCFICGQEGHRQDACPYCMVMPARNNDKTRLGVDIAKVAAIADQSKRLAVWASVMSKGKIGRNCDEKAKAKYQKDFEAACAKSKPALQTHVAVLCDHPHLDHTRVGLLVQSVTEPTQRSVDTLTRLAANRSSLSESLDAITKKEFSNQHLTHLSLGIERPSSADVIEFTELKNRSLFSSLHTDTVYPVPPSAQNFAMSDEGAATSLCSMDFVRMYHLEDFITAAGDLSLSGYNGAQEHEKRFKVHFILVVQGRDEMTGLPATLRILEEALVISPMSTPLLLGSDFLAKHGVINDHGASLSTFRSNGRRIVLSCAPWSDAEQSVMRAQQVQLSANQAVLITNAATTCSRVSSAIRNTANCDEWSVDEVGKLDKIDLLEKAVTEPRSFLKYVSLPYTVGMLVGLIVLCQLYQCQVGCFLEPLRKAVVDAEGNPLSTHSLAFIANGSADTIFSAVQVTSTVIGMFLAAATKAVSHTRPVASIIPPPRSPLNSLVTNSSPPVSEFLFWRQNSDEEFCLMPDAVEPSPTTTSWGGSDPEYLIVREATIGQQHSPSLTEHEQFVLTLSEECKELSPELRPELFPPDLWRFVADSQKPSTKARWDAFPPDYLKECLELADKNIRIFQGTPERAEQAPLWRAQCYANIDRYFYPDPDNPPTIPGVEINIVLKDPNCIPESCKPRRHPPMGRECLKMRTDKMIRCGKLENSTSAWNNPVHLVAYPDRIKAFLAKHGNNATLAMLDRANEDEVIGMFRMTGDFRKLNLLSVLERFPLPRILELIDQCDYRSNRYSAGDIADAFYCIRLSDACRHLTAFSTADAHLQYCVMPQGVKSAAMFWARTIANIFADLLHTLKLMIYQDDVLVHARGLSEHFRTWQSTLDRLGLHKLVFKPSKTTLNFPEHKCLGHILSEFGRSVDPGLVATICKIGPPRNLTDVQSLLGLAKVASDYVPDLAAVLAPINELNRKGVDIPAAWGAAQQDALDQLKTILTTAPVLMLPDLSRPFRVHVDACRVGRGMGAVLLQQNPLTGKWQPVAYWSRALTEQERKASATQLECTAMHDCILHWHPYLYGTGFEFELITDHYALCYLVTKMGGTAQSVQRLTRLCLDLQSYSFSVTHRKGTEHLDADAVSRLLLVDDEPFVHTELTLRDDWGPLSEQDRADIFASAAPREAEWLISTIDSCRHANLTERARLSAAHVSLVTAAPPAPTPETATSLMCNCQTVCQTCSAAICTGDSGAVIESCTTLRTNKVSMAPPEQLTSLANTGTKQLNKLISDSSLRLHSEENKLRRNVYLQELVERTICKHPFEMDPVEHQKQHPACRPDSIRSNRTAVLQTMVQQSSELQLSREQSRRIADELLGRLRNKTSEPRTRKHKRQRSRAKNELFDDGIYELDSDGALILCPVEVQLQLTNALDPHKASNEAHHNTRRAREHREQEAERQQELLDAQIEKYFYLHGLTYLDPVSNQLYQIIDTKIQRRAAKNGGPVVTTVAWPINSHQQNPPIDLKTQCDQTQWQVRDFRETDVLVQGMLRAKNPADGTPYPTSADDWLALQQRDERLNGYIDALQPSMCFHLTHQNPRQSGTHFDYLHRPVLANGTMGPLTRSYTLRRKISNGNTEHFTVQVINQIVVPAAMIPAVLHQHHDCMGHPGAARTYQTSRLKYWWSTQAVDCKAYAVRCRHCELRKANNRVARTPVQEYPVPPFPFHTVAVDLTGPFPKSHGYVYILVLKDALGKWVELEPLYNKTAVSIAEALLPIFLRHGAPRHMLSDRGREFTNSLLKSVCKVLETHQIFITPQNPRSNGMAENFMRTLKDMLSAHVNAKQNNWSEYLASVAHVYNTTVNHATGYTPFYLLYGRQCATPDTLFLEEKPSKDAPTSDLAQELRDTLSLAWASLCGSTWSQKTERYNSRPAKPLEFKHYAVNDLIFIKRVPRRFYRDQQDEEAYILSSKLQPRYSGPYRITEVLSDVLYRAQVHGKSKTVHAVNIKPAKVALNVADPVDDDDLADRQLDADIASQNLTSQDTLPAPPTADQLQDKVEVHQRTGHITREDAVVLRDRHAAAAQQLLALAGHPQHELT